MLPRFLKEEDDDDDLVEGQKASNKAPGKGAKAKAKGRKCAKKRRHPKKAKPETSSSPEPLKDEKAEEPTYPGCLYTPGRFKEARAKYIQECRRRAMSYKDACAAWNLSDERSELLAGMPHNEMVRRRFA